MTDRKEKVPCFKIGERCIFLGGGENKILNLQERRITERTKILYGFEGEGGIKGTQLTF